MSIGAGSPCGACKFLRRKCALGCIFAPHFCSEQGPAQFSAIHKVFGASNVSKLLLTLPVHDRCEAVVTITYEAQARLRDPVYGCVAHIFALQQQVAYLQAQLMQTKTQLLSNNNQVENHWFGTSLGHNSNVIQQQFDTQSCLTTTNTIIQGHNNNNYINTPFSPQSSLDSIDQFDGVIQDKTKGIIGMKRSLSNMGELHELAIRMMRN